MTDAAHEPTDLLAAVQATAMLADVTLMLWEGQVRRLWRRDQDHPQSRRRRGYPWRPGSVDVRLRLRDRPGD